MFRATVEMHGDQSGIAMVDGQMRQTNLRMQGNKAWDVCIVGAGLSGTVLAERYATLLNKTSIVIEKRHHIGGNCYDYIDHDTNILMNEYGAHLFHTNIERVWSYVNKWARHAPWVRWDHEVLGWVQGKLVPIPVNIKTVNTLLNGNISNTKEMDDWLKNVQGHCPATGCRNAEEMAIHRVGKQLYNLIFKDYTLKQWGVSPERLDAEVTARIPVRNSFDPRYFSDRYQALPAHGYSHWFNHVLSNSKINVVVNTDFFDVQTSLHGRCGKTIFTGPIDKYFAASGLPKLEYRSIRFEKIVMSQLPGYFQEASVVNYPGTDVDFTRIVEYKHFLRQRSTGTVVVKEFSSDDGDPYYPVPNKRNKDLYAAYRKLAVSAAAVNNTHFVGRLANYKYFNMDAAVDNALSFFTYLEGVNHIDLGDSKKRLPRICGVTVVLGGYEKTLKQPPMPQSYKSWKLYAFTDRPDALFPGEWTVADIKSTPIFSPEVCNETSWAFNSPCKNKNPMNIGKYVKTQMYKIPAIQTNCDVAVWMDATVKIQSTDFFQVVADRLEKGNNLLVFEHQPDRRGRIDTEVAVSLGVGRYTVKHAYGHPQPYQDVRAQYRNYLAEGFKEHWWENDTRFNMTKKSPQFGMWVTCLVVLDLRREETKRFLDVWWHENLRHSTQDQIGFPYAIWKTKTMPTSLPDKEWPGSWAKSRHHVKLNHGV